MTPHTAIETISLAASKDDRWLFVALLGIGLFFVVFLFRWFTARLERVETKMDAQSAEFTDYLQTANREMLEVISQNQTTTTRAIALMDRLEHKLDTTKNTP